MIPPHLELNDGNRMPQLGLGTFQVPARLTMPTVLNALSTGYRMVDTAAAYRNEAEVFQAVRRSNFNRKNVFITTKLSNNDHGRTGTIRGVQRSVKRLGGGYIDLYLIHWPLPLRDRYVETWLALTELKARGLARSIGVANFEIEHLERIIDASGVVPAVNQVELHPHMQQAELRRFHVAHGIATEAWSPLEQGRILHDPVIKDLARSSGRTPAQIVLRWQLQLGNIAIPKSITPGRIEENFAVFDFELGDDEMRAISTLETGQRIGGDPATFAGPHGVRRALSVALDRYPAAEPIALVARRTVDRVRKG